MGNLQHQQAPAQWAKEQFSGVELADVRRTRRVVRMAEAMATAPGGSLPQLFATYYEVKAAYTLLRRPEVTPDRLQAVHRKAVKAELAQPGEYLLIEDTTEMSWSGQQPKVGLGPIGQGSQGTQGFLLHSVLAVRWALVGAEARSPRRLPVEMLGICDQQSYVRSPRPVGEKPSDWWASHQRERESQLWERAGERIGAVPGTRGVRWVRVCDRGADIYEHLQSCRALGQGFVVRAAQDRAVLVAGSGQRARLFATARQGVVLGECEVELRARSHHPARRARLQVGATAVELCAPRRPRQHAPALTPVPCTVIRVWEEAAPAGHEPLEWVLLSDAGGVTWEQALACVRQYATRWLVEEYHKALKSGLGAERLQLETAAGLMAAIALMSVVAVRLLVLREGSRLQPLAPATDAGLDAVELAVLQCKVGRPLATVNDVALALGRLGGHLNRRHDGLPGWQTLWRGMATLQTLVEGVRLSRQLEQFG